MNSQTPIKAIIVDDEQLAIDTLTWQLQEFCNGVEIIASFNNPNLAFEFINNNSIDLCFLDIEMPEMTGFEFLKLWDNSFPFEVIFTTAYNEFAIQAFKVSAFDYLLKPIDEDELVSTTQKLIKKKTRSKMEQFELLFQAYNKPKEYTDRIALPTAEGIHFIQVDDIIRLEAHKNYTTVYLSTKTPIIVSKTIKDVECLLDSNRFFRTHQSHIIDLRKVEMYQRGRGGSVILTSGDVVPVSKQKKDDLMIILNIK